MNEFSREERVLLLRLAHQAVEAAAYGRPFLPEIPESPLTKPRGVFTTLYRRRELRGCVGYVFPVTPLYRGVVETAQAAALEDSRFRPIRPDELPELQVSLSILSALSPIEAERIEVGRHGLLVSMGGHRGLLLPQVPLEHGWDRSNFLQQTCQKAGLPPDAWAKGARLQAFTAEVFGDADMRS